MTTNDHPVVVSALSPHDPVLVEGADLILNCTIEPQYSGSFNYTDIYFQKGTREYRGSPDVQFMEPSSALLTLHQVTLEDSGHVTCCLPDRPMRSGIRAMQHVTVFSE